MTSRSERVARRMRRRRRVRIAEWTVVVFFGVLTLSSLLGGPIRFIVVQGTSMEPTLESGDLVVVQDLVTPKVGDVTAFPVRTDLRTVHVIHRIVGGTPERFDTKGDNRKSGDQWHPSADDVDGVMWFNIPRLGAALTGPVLRLWAAAAIGIVLTLALWDPGDYDDSDEEDDDESTITLEDTGVTSTVISIRAESDRPLAGVGGRTSQPVRRTRRHEVRTPVDWESHWKRPDPPGEQ